jgi:hypothetical protein
MPFRSQAQRRYLEANLPEVAKQFEAETPAEASARLPERVSRSKGSQRGESRLSRSSSLRR